MISQVAHKPASLVTDTSITADSGLGRFQSIPVEGRRWTLSTSTDQAAIARPVSAIASSAELGPERGSARAGNSNAVTSAGHRRAKAIQPSSVARPTKPTHGDTSLAGSRVGGEDGALMART